MLKTVGILAGLASAAVLVRVGFWGVHELYRLNRIHRM